MQALHHFEKADSVELPRHGDVASLGERPAGGLGGVEFRQVFAAGEQPWLPQYPDDDILVEPIPVGVPSAVPFHHRHPGPVLVRRPRREARLLILEGFQGILGVLGGLGHARLQLGLDGGHVLFRQVLIGAVLAAALELIQRHLAEAGRPRGAEGILGRHRLEVLGPHRDDDIFQFVDDERGAVKGHGLPVQKDFQLPVVLHVVEFDDDLEVVILHGI